MRYLIFLLIIVSSISVQSQKKFKNGPYEKYYKNGQLKTSGQYLNNEKVGDWKGFYETGELKSTYSYTKGEADVERKSYFKNGKIKTETSQTTDGDIFKEFFETGELFFEKKLDGGYAKDFYKNGNLKASSNYLDDELVGDWKSYLETGELEWEVNYVSSYQDGTYKEYYNNGQLKTEGSNKKGEKEGLEKRYFEDGKLKWEGRYSSGLFHGKWKGYNQLGEEIYSLKYKNGVLLKNEDAGLEATLVPSGLIEVIPVYPGCEEILGFKDQRNCMSKNVAQFIAKKFNTDMASNLGLIGRQKIYVIFKIDKTGNITGVRARAPHPELEAESIRVIKQLPSMKPGLKRGKPVVIPYSLPIIFSIQK